MDQTCKTCKFSHPSIPRMECHRYPQAVQKSPAGWCGEWTSQPPKAPEEPPPVVPEKKAKAKKAKT